VGAWTFRRWIGLKQCFNNNQEPVTTRENPDPSRHDGSERRLVHEERCGHARKKLIPCLETLARPTKVFSQESITTQWSDTGLGLLRLLLATHKSSWGVPGPLLVYLPCEATTGPLQILSNGCPHSPHLNLFTILFELASYLRFYSPNLLTSQMFEDIETTINCAQSKVHNGNITMTCLAQDVG
jgi:hypothetical protein